MKNLSPDWFFRYPVDFEYSRWILLDYLNDVYSNFKYRKLYPYLHDINYHLTNLESWDTKRELFKGELKGVDFEKMTLIYDTPEDSPEIKEINNIVNYSIDEMRRVFKKGRIVWRSIEEQFNWNIIGVIPNYKLEGYLLVKINNQVKVFRYTIGSVILEDDKYGTMNLEEISTEEWGLGVYDHIKWRLIKERELACPLTISVEVPDVPYNETIVPMIKKLSLIKIHNI